MTETIEKFLSWKVVACAVCVLVIGMASSVWSERAQRMQQMDQRIEKKLDTARYESDLNRLEKKIDILLSINIDGRK